MIKVGCDIVYLTKFSSSLKRGKNTFLQKLFTDSELRDNRLEHLAGLMAAKEAIAKALAVGVGHWRNIEIVNDNNGRPKAKLLEPLASKHKKVEIDISISHDKDYAMAIAAIEFNNDIR